MMTVLSFLAALAQDMLLAAIPAAGFAMVFNVPKRALKYCALLGAIGHGSRFMLIAAGFDIVAATFWASVLVGIIGIQWSRWWLAHPKVFTVAAIIPMFPGINAYMAMLAVIKLSQSGFTGTAGDAGEQFPAGGLCGRRVVYRAVCSRFVVVPQASARLTDTGQIQDNVHNRFIGHTNLNLHPVATFLHTDINLIIIVGTGGADYFFYHLIDQRMHRYSPEFVLMAA